MPLTLESGNVGVWEHWNMKRNFSTFQLFNLPTLKKLLSKIDIYVSRGHTKRLLEYEYDVHGM